MRRVRTAGCALVLAAAGCSGGGGDDFAAEANAVCADYDERIAAIETPADLDALSGSAEESEADADALAEELGLEECLVEEG